MAVREHPVTVDPAVDRAADPPRSLSAVGGSLLVRAAPSLVFLGVRAVGLPVLGWLASIHGGRMTTLLSKWDGLWLLGIAGGGYDGVPAGLVDAFGRRAPETPLAFFPGYPGAVGVVRFVTGTSPVVAGLIVSLVAGLVLAHGLARLGELVPGGSRRAGLLLVGLVAAAPMGVVWTMTYSEGLFTACAVWALVAMLRRHWVLAGAFTALAGTVRPTAAALLVAVGGALLLAALAGLRRDRAGEPEVGGGQPEVGGREPEVGSAEPGVGGGAPRGGWQPWVGGLLAPLGLLGYLAWVAVRVGSLDGWFAVQRRGWNSRFDGGAATAEFTHEVLASGRSVLEVGTVAVLVGAVALLAVCVRQALARELPWPLVVYAAGVLMMDVGSNGLMNSKARLLLPAVTLLVPVAVALARRRPSTAAWVLVAAALGSAWFGGYALTIWQYAI
ncbi:MAG: hypothetical protein ACT4O0_20380 [Pseudonocardia sp.]